MRKAIIAAFGGLLVPGAILATPVAHADLCSALAVGGTAWQACEKMVGSVPCHPGHIEYPSGGDPNGVMVYDPPGCNQDLPRDQP